MFNLFKNDMEIVPEELPTESDVRDVTKSMLNQYCLGHDPNNISPYYPVGAGTPTKRPFPNPIPAPDPNYEHIRNPANISDQLGEYYPDMEYINKVCTHVSEFAETVYNAMGDIDADTLRRLVCQNSVTGHTWKKNDGCKPVYKTQAKLRRLVPHLVHIVQDFGILLPMKFHNLEHAGRREPFVSDTDILQKWDNHSLPDKLYERGRYVRNLMIRRVPNSTDLIFNKGPGINPGNYYESLFSSNTKKFLEKTSDIFEIYLLSQDIIDQVAEKMNTLLKLRYIDTIICNRPDDDHVAAFNGLLERFVDTIRTKNEHGEDFNQPVMFAEIIPWVPKERV